MTADLAIAWLVQDFLSRHGATERVRVAATLLVAFGPVFVAASAVEGQVDSVAFLPVVLALYLWDRLPERRAAAVVGLLLGVGAAIKTVPLVMVLAFVPLLSNWRIALRLLVCALVVPVAVVIPFALAWSPTVHDILNYQGFPGWGGLGMFVQPELTRHLLRGTAPPWNQAQFHLQQTVRILLPVLVVLATARSARRRARPEITASLLLLTIYVFSPNYFPQYLVWGLPIFLMAGFVRQVAFGQALLVIPLVIEAQSPWHTGVVFWPYLIGMAAIWLLGIGAWGGLMFGARRRAETSPQATNAHLANSNV